MSSGIAEPWITGAQARKLGRLSAYQLMRLAALDLIRIRADRGQVRFYAPDVIKACEDR